MFYDFLSVEDTLILNCKIKAQGGLFLQNQEKKYPGSITSEIYFIEIKSSLIYRQKKIFIP